MSQDRRKLQFFCSDKQLEQSKDLEAPWGLIEQETRYWDEFKIACEKDSDCKEDLSQQCTYILWDATLSGDSYANGVACYSWDTPVCPGAQFAAVNVNFEKSNEFSYYTQYDCTKNADGATSLLASIAMAVTALTLFF